MARKTHVRFVQLSEDMKNLKVKLKNKSVMQYGAVISSSLMFGGLDVWQ